MQYSHIQRGYTLLFKLKHNAFFEIIILKLGINIS